MTRQAISDDSAKQKGRLGKPEDEKRDISDSGEGSGGGELIILSVIWKGRKKETANGRRMIDTEAGKIFLAERWMRESEIATKRGSCVEMVRLTDKRKKKI